MNLNVYGTYYGKFHGSSVSFARDNILVFGLAYLPFENYWVSRMYPSLSVAIDSNKPFVMGLKAFFKSDVPASVFCNETWTLLLGNERVIFPVSKESELKNIGKRLFMYATPYFVSDPQLISQFLQSSVKPAYENVFFYKNSILYLDNQDLPYPGGCYFDKCDPTPYYRICFLSEEPIDYVLNLAAEWKVRRDIVNIPFMTREVKAVPKFIKFKPVPNLGIPDSAIVSTGMISKKLSARKSELFLQDVLTSFYNNSSRRPNDGCVNVTCIGLILEWPFLITFDGSRHYDTKNDNREFVALSVNGNNPSRVLYVSRPYDRYIEYNQVPATLWTPIYFELSTLLTDSSIRKVAVDTVVVGLTHQNTFYCLSQPLLEGIPTRRPTLNARYLLSVEPKDRVDDGIVTILDTFRYDDQYSLRRVRLKGFSDDAWCLTQAENNHPRPFDIRLPELVQEWLNFFKRVGENTFDTDVSTIRLALALSRHNLCYNLKVVPNPSKAFRVTNEIDFYLNEKSAQFLNEARLSNKETSTSGSSCSIS